MLFVGLNSYSSKLCSFVFSVGPSHRLEHMVKCRVPNEMI